MRGIIGGLIFILLVMLSGCGADNRIELPFTAADVAYAEVFTGSVPAQAKMKTVTGVNDIVCICKTFNEMVVKREAADADMTAGGIGTLFRFRLTNGRSYTVHTNGSLIRTAAGMYVTANESFDTDSFWKSLEYDETAVAENELPAVN